MSDKKLHHKAYSEWREQAADEYIQAQRRAFLDGFETAAKESEQFNLLREWAEQKRDEAATKNEQEESMNWYYYRQAIIDLLVKLSEINNHPDGESTNYE